MADTTTKGFPYPEGPDAVDVAGDIQALAEAVDDMPGVQSYTGAEIAALAAGEKWAGRIVWNSTTGKLQVSNGSTFSDVDTSSPLSSANPQALGSAAAGSSTDVSRADHVHPTTGLIASSLVSNTKGAVPVGTGSAVAALSPGSNGQIPMADSGATNGLRYVDPPASRNLLINSAMQVHQRGTSATGITTSGYYTADRYRLGLAGLGTWTQTVETDAPSGSGFTKSLKHLCTTADNSPAAADVLFLDQRLEGQDLQRIKKGTASAEQITLSFWVKANVTGTYVALLLDFDNTRQVGQQYTVSQNGTWERKVVTFPADTTGALDNDNALSLSVRFYLGAGSNFTSGTLRSAWASTTDADLAVGQTNLAAATNNYWQITGVQLEASPVATPFEFEPYEATLRKCQRYYYRIEPGAANRAFAMGWNTTTSNNVTIVPFPVLMRIRPTALEQSGTAGHYQVAHGATAATCTSVPTYNADTHSQAGVVNFPTAATMTAGNGAAGYTLNAAAYLAWSAEL